MVNSEFHILVTAKANERKIIVMNDACKSVTQKRAKDFSDYKQIGPWIKSL